MPPSLETANVGKITHEVWKACSAKIASLLRSLGIEIFLTLRTAIAFLITPIDQIKRMIRFNCYQKRQISSLTSKKLKRLKNFIPLNENLIDDESLSAPLVC